jgi:hypothetical protein
MGFFDSETTRMKKDAKNLAKIAFDFTNSVSSYDRRQALKALMNNKFVMDEFGQDSYDPIIQGVHVETFMYKGDDDTFDDEVTEEVGSWVVRNNQVFRVPEHVVAGEQFDVLFINNTSGRVQCAAIPLGGNTQARDLVDKIDANDKDWANTLRELGKESADEWDSVCDKIIVEKDRIIDEKDRIIEDLKRQLAEKESIPVVESCHVSNHYEDSSDSNTDKRMETDGRREYQLAAERQQMNMMMMMQGMQNNQQQNNPLQMQQMFQMMQNMNTAPPLPQR